MFLLTLNISLTFSLLLSFLSLYLSLWYIIHSNPTIKKIRSWWGFLFSPYQESSDQSNTHQSIKSQNTPKKRGSASNFKAFFFFLQKCLCRLCLLLPQLFFHQRTSHQILSPLRNSSAMSSATIAKPFLR